MQENRLSKALALFLPGIFLLGFNIGTGSVTSMAKAGATYGTVARQDRPEFDLPIRLVKRRDLPDCGRA